MHCHDTQAHQVLSCENAPTTKQAGTWGSGERDLGHDVEMTSGKMAELLPRLMMRWTRRTVTMQAWHSVHRENSILSWLKLYAVKKNIFWLPLMPWKAEAVAQLRCPDLTMTVIHYIYIYMHYASWYKKTTTSASCKWCPLQVQVSICANWWQEKHHH